MLTTSNLDLHVEYLQKWIDLGFQEIHVHNVNREQQRFIEAFGEHVVPAIART